MKNKCLVSIISICFLGLFLWNLFGAKPEFSESERRKLASAPEMTVESVFEGSFSADFESYAVDRFVARDLWRRVKAYTSTGIFVQKDNNGIYVADDHISKIEYPLNQKMLGYSMNLFGSVYEKNLADSNVYFAVIPDKNRYLAMENGVLSLDYESLDSFVEQRLDFAEFIEIADLLEADDYYYTDPHWRQEKIVDVAERLLMEMGAGEGRFAANLSASGHYTEQHLSYAFEGAYVGQSALAVNEEAILYLTNEVTEHAVVTVFNDGVIPSKNEATKHIYNMELAKDRDPYEMFLSGNQAIVRVVNPLNENGRRLILFRDSYGSAIAPLLLEGYSEMILIDLRYVGSQMLGELVDFEGADVLFLYSTLLLNNSMSMK